MSGTETIRTEKDVKRMIEQLESWRKNLIAGSPLDILTSGEIQALQWVIKEGNL